ncbi:MAG: alpha/beta hydrolase [Ruminococcaceae bacterium]|nr:alpha/beta hydrolase [Oscillospiraceae bacterium]
MNFHTFGDKSRPAMLLIHGMLTPWQIWQEVAEKFSDEYFVIVPALDAHEEDTRSEFKSVEQEAEKIEKFCLANTSGDIAVMCGISMGGVIAFEIFRSGKLTIDKFILDGAPLVGFNKLLGAIMQNRYKSLIHKSQLRAKGIMRSFKKNFLPEKYIDSYLAIADRMSDTSIENIINSLSHNRLTGFSSQEKTKILFCYGTKGNEGVSETSAFTLKGLYSNLTLKCFQKCAHCRYISYEPQKWIEEIKPFIY